MVTLTDQGRAVVDRFRDLGVGILPRDLPQSLDRPSWPASRHGLDGLVRVMGARTARHQPIPVQGAHGTP